MLRRTAPAKINLGLHILRRRSDGYHDIETVFVRIPWVDVLEAEAADALTLTCSDPSLPTGETNLVVRAARALSPERGARIHLKKHLPAGAGLGGGSSDAAAALVLLNELWQLGKTTPELRALAADIGSDVAFFVDGPASALGTGRGEVVEPLVDPGTGEPYVLPYPIVVVAPPVHVSTADAYGMIRTRGSGRADLKALILSNDLERWRRELANDFEVPVLEAYPAIAEAKHALENAGADYAALSGSGSAVFGIFSEEANAEAAAEALRQTGHRVWHGRVDG